MKSSSSIGPACPKAPRASRVEDLISKTVRKRGATLDRGMASLFMAISQGLNWQDIINPLRDVSALAVTLVLTYVILTIFAILNVLGRMC